MMNDEACLPAVRPDCGSRLWTQDSRLTPLFGVQCVPRKDKAEGSRLNAKVSIAFGVQCVPDFRLQPSDFSLAFDVSNALRHSFISYRIADIQNVAQVALEAGNSPQIIFQHYRELVRLKEAKSWFAIELEKQGDVIQLRPKKAKAA